MRRKANLGPARLSRIHYFENNRQNLSSHVEVVISGKVGKNSKNRLFSEITSIR